jgi:anthranilate phosphoribosyltransferase
VLLNTAAALLVADRVHSLSTGWDRAAELLDSGEAARHLDRIIQASSALPQADPEPN